MMSILQNEKECYLCRKKALRIGYYDVLPSTGLHKHHIVFGTAGRALSEREGLWVWVCAKLHHEHGSESPHKNAEVKKELIIDAQKRFEEIHSHERWMEIFGRNWIGVD